MFNSVQYVRDLCKKRNIPISQLEKDCGFANGYLNPKKLSKLPYDRAVIIAEYLKVSAADILGASKTENAPAEDGKRTVTDDDIMFALWGDTNDVDKDDLDDVKRYAAFVRERKLKK